MKNQTEHKNSEVRRRLLKTGALFLLGSLRWGYGTPIVNAQSDTDLPPVDPTNISSPNALINPLSSEKFEPYPGRPWTRAVTSVSDSSGRVDKWEWISITTPEKPFKFSHNPNVGNWSMQSLLGGQPIDVNGDVLVLTELELDTPPSEINTGIMVHNNEPVTEGNHRRISVGARGSDLYFAYWDGSPSRSYTVNIPSISPLNYDQDNRLLLNVGIYLPADGKYSKLLLPDGNTTSPIDLKGTSFKNPGQNKIDVAVSTTPEVQNTVNKLMIIHKLSSPKTIA